MYVLISKTKISETSGRLDQNFNFHWDCHGNKFYKKCDCDGNYAYSIGGVDVGRFDFHEGLLAAYDSLQKKIKDGLDRVNHDIQEMKKICSTSKDREWDK